MPALIGSSLRNLSRATRSLSLRLTIAATLAVGLAFTGLPRAAQAAPITQTFTTTGVESTFVVPADVFSVTITAYGGQGFGDGFHAGSGGYGAAVTATVPVTPNETLYVDVGSAGSQATGGTSGASASGGNAGANDSNNGFEGGGGGGATQVSTCSTTSSTCIAQYYTASEPRLVVAAGGGGGGGDGGCSGGNGGAGVGRGQGNGPHCQPAGGGGGGNGNGSSGVSFGDDTGGGGATQAEVGSAGMDTIPGCIEFYESNGQPGIGPVGGNGYDSTAGQEGAWGGGGGGGYYGGGGGSSDWCDSFGGAGGGAGSSYAAADATNVSYGNATTVSSEVVIAYTPLPGGYVPGGNTGTSSTHWAGTTTYTGFTCRTIVPSYGGSFYENNTSTPIIPGDIVVPGTSSELDAPTSKTEQCSFQTTERPPTNLFTSGTSSSCLARSGVVYPAESWYQTENTAGLITIHCVFEVYGDG